MSRKAAIRFWKTVRTQAKTSSITWTIALISLFITVCVQWHLKISSDNERRRSLLIAADSECTRNLTVLHVDRKELEGRRTKHYADPSFIAALSTGCLERVVEEVTSRNAIFEHQRVAASQLLRTVGDLDHAIQSRNRYCEEVAAHGLGIHSLLEIEGRINSQLRRMSVTIEEYQRGLREAIRKLQ